MKKELATILAQLGNRTDQQTGAISALIYLSTTYAHPNFGESTGFDYTRTKNPTRSILEEGLAQLEGGAGAVATSSGMSAIQLAFSLFPTGSRFLVSRVLYGGSYRFFQELEAQGAATFTYFADLDDLERQLTADTVAVFLETPTNPLMHVTDIASAAALAHAQGASLLVDNTFLTPLRQQPLLAGADIVIHSGTKFLSGHNDLLAGVVIAKEPAVYQRLAFLANTTGPCLGSFDSWLFIRSLKTFPLRFEKQEANAKRLVDFLQGHPAVKEVLYPGIGAMISFRLQEEAVPKLLQRLQLISFAESLGGVETLITYPTTQTHADIPQALRESYGLTPDLLRLSVGIEGINDLVADLIQALREE